MEVWLEDHFPFFSWVIFRFQPLIFWGKNLVLCNQDSHVCKRMSISSAQLSSDRLSEIGGKDMVRFGHRNYDNPFS